MTAGVKVPRILVVEDERKISDVIRAYLEQAGFEVLLAADGEAGLAQVPQFRPDLVILDLMLPKVTGEEVCRRLRQDSDVPILMLTAKSREEDRVEGLKIGADDYLVKPFSPRELVARVRAVLRRTRSEDLPQVDVLSFGHRYLVIDALRHEVVRDGKPVKLTPNEFKLLLTLARYPRRVYSRAQLTEKVMGFDYEGYDRTIDAHIKNLRQKIEPAPEEPRFIKTVYGVGYKFED